MTGLEVIVVIAGLFLGYWVVSRFLPGGPPTRPAADPPPPVASWPSWHQVLKVAPDATVDEIRQAYRSLMSQYHPDKVAALGEELRNLAELKSKEINQAYLEALRQRGVDA